MADVPIEVLLGALRNVEQRLREVAERLSTVCAVQSTPGLGAWRGMAGHMTVSSATFLSPAARLAVCEASLCSRGLALRALYARGSQVRRCVDRERLAALRSAVGADGLSRLLALAPVRGAVEPDWPAELTAHALAADGLARLRHPGGIDDPSLVYLLSLRHDWPQVPALDESADIIAITRESARFFADLPSLLPEFL
ncbi:type III secretion protein HrpB4 [Pandoraea sp. NPDC087047]|uniref:type III secretion protein HrpB4 n=1 Tax=Pandoraea sp. NPDC087047 TaxID=3364390 RepID=UPI003826BF3C